MAELVHTILLVTWFYTGQAPSSYHVEFSNSRNCEQARQALIAARNATVSKPELVAVCVAE